MKKIILSSILLFSSVSFAGTAVQAIGDSNSYRMSESLSKSVARVDAKEGAAKNCSSGQLEYDSWNYSAWYTYGNDPRSSEKAKREGYRHKVTVNATCK